MPGFKIGSFVSASTPSSIEPIYTYMWEAPIFPDPTGAVLLKECDPPSFSVDTETVQGGSLQYKYAKSVSWKDVKLTFYDTMGLKDHVLKAKRNVVWNPETGLGLAYSANQAGYKFNCDIKLLGIDNSSAGGWQLQGAWVKDISWAKLTYTNSDIHTVTVTLSYDWAIDR